MVWVFTKNGQQLRCEVAHGDTSGHYRIVITRPDRSRTIDDIDAPVALAERTVAVMNDLRNDGWQLA